MDDGSTSAVKPRKVKGKEVGKEVAEEKPANETNNAHPPKVMPFPGFYMVMWILARIVLLFATFIFVWFPPKDYTAVYLAQFEDSFDNRHLDVKCSEEYFKDTIEFEGCVPVKCGRVVMDKLLTWEETETLIDIAKKGLALGGSDGGSSIFDLHSGLISKGKNFINIFSFPNITDIFRIRDIDLYTLETYNRKVNVFVYFRRVRKKIQEAVAYSFNIDSDKLYLTRPMFVSRFTSKDPASSHDVYWHTNVDKKIYQFIYYTSVVYLNTYNNDFEGGRFIFEDPEYTLTFIEPKRGRVTAFTSGKENPHRVERVTSGTWYGIQIPFTCNKKYAMKDPNFKP